MLPFRTAAIPCSITERAVAQSPFRHLRYLLERYRGSVVLALAAYNAGEGAVDTHRAIPPYPETQRYVQRVLRRAGLADPLATVGTLHRYLGPGDVTTYSNLPPRPGH